MTILRTHTRAALALLTVLAATALFAPPLIGWPHVVRLPAILVPVFVGALLLVRPWGWAAGDWDAIATWQPSARVVWSGASVLALILFWCVLTRFESGDINAVDFTVYFDRPCFQTVHGRPLYVEVANIPELSYKSALGIHAYWLMIPVAYLYALHATPFWLLALSVVAVVGGAVHALRIVQRVGGGGTLACATAVAFALNANTARTLNYGFHPEVLYAWFVPWMIDAGVHGKVPSLFAAAIACVLVKEDAFLPLASASIALVLVCWRRMPRMRQYVVLIGPTALALLNLGLYYRFVLPAFSGAERPIYAGFWGNYGPTPWQAVVGMVRHPLSVISRAAGSGFLSRVLVPHLYLPLVGWRWFVGALPIVVLFGASANVQIRAFGIYYAIVLVPFLTIGASAGALALASRVLPRGRAGIAAGVVVVLGALLVGSQTAGYSLRPWKPELRSVTRALAQLGSEPVVLVQSGLYTHAGYESRVRLLTPETLRDPANARAAVLLSPAVSGYPFPADAIRMLASRPSIAAVPDGLRAVRVGD